MNPYFMHGGFWGGPFGIGPWWGTGFAAAFAGAIIVAVLWTLVWKGLALWHAAKNGQKWWFLALLVINTAGILEIIYLFGFRANRATTPLFKKSVVAPASPAASAPAPIVPVSPAPTAPESSVPPSV